MWYYSRGSQLLTGGSLGGLLEGLALGSGHLRSSPGRSVTPEPNVSAPLAHFRGGHMAETAFLLL
jgi:hypothetical protein